jgi:transformation/transcription domain-associated protein
LYESAKIVKDINGATRHAKLTEIKNGILKSWRERLPCETDDMTLWSDILQWRQHVYSMINNAIPPTDSSFLGFHETAWSINKLARVARKQGLFEMCINSLAKIYQLPNIDLQEAFAKLREQIKCFTGLPAYYRTAVDIINSTNLEFFNAQQRAEFFQLKGDFLQRLGSYEEATTAFSTSVLLFDNLAKGWIGWAKFHDDRFRIAVSTGDHKSALVSANHAVSCYLQGVKSSQVPSSRKHLGRVLWLLSFDGEAPEGSDVASSLPTDDEAATPSAETKVDASQETKDVEMSEADSFFVGEGSGENTNNAKRDANFEKPPPPNAKRPKSEETEDGNERHEVKATAPGADAPASSPESELEAELAPFKKRLLSNSFVQHVKNVPQWVWWPWIPQLLHALHRVEGPVMKWLLVRLAQSYPHAVFPHLSLFQKEQRAYDRMVQGDKNLPFPLKASQQILDTMRTKWPNIVSDLEKIAEEVDIISQLSAEEVLQEDLQLIMKAVLDGTPTDINEHLARINRTSVRELSSAAMKKEFERDLINHQSVTHPPYLVSTLRTWLKRLRTTITNTPGSIDLERRSMFLAEFQNDSFTEIPGQYAEGREATSEHHINIERFESPVRVIRSGHGPRRMLSLRGTNGKVYTYFIDRASETSLLLDPEQVELGTQTSVLDWSRQYRFADSLRVVNRVWTKAPQTRRRGLQISAPVFQPLSPRLRLIAADTDSVPLQVIFEEWADTQRNVSADLSAHAHEQLFQQSSRLAAQIFEYCCNASPDTILVDVR